MTAAYDSDNGNRTRRMTSRCEIRSERSDDRSDCGKEIGGFAAKSIGENAAVRRTGGVDAVWIDDVVFLDIADDLTNERDIVDARLRSLSCSAPVVPRPLDPSGIRDDEAFPIGQRVEAAHLLHALGRARAAMENDDQRRRRGDVRWHMNDVAAVAPLRQQVHDREKESGHSVLPRAMSVARSICAA